MNEYICEIQTTATNMLLVVIVIGEKDEPQLRACLYVVIDGVGGERTKSEVEIRLCVCVEMVDARDGWWWWCLILPPARRVPVPVPVPGILEPGKLPLCACLECRNYPSRDSEGKLPDLRMVAILVVVCVVWYLCLYLG